MFCMHCGIQLEAASASCPSCGTPVPGGAGGATGVAAAPAAAPDPQVAVSMPSTQAAGGIPRKALWIGGGLVAALVIVYAIAAGGGEKLTTQRAQQAVSQWSGGGIAVTGVQEIPQ